jgi:peroxiredoxin
VSSGRNPAHEWVRIQRILARFIFDRPKPGVRAMKASLAMAGATVAVFLSALACTARLSAEDQITPQGVVIGADQKPLAGVQVSLHRWDGKMSPALETTETDASGRFQFPTRATDAYFYVVLRKSGLATLSFTASAESPVKATMRPAVESWIEVRDENGRPLSGAQVANLEILSAENGQTYAWRGMERLLGWKFGPSDSTGRLDLPPLPEGVNVEIRITHPDWAQAKVTKLEAVAGQIGTAVLPAGVKTRFELAADPRTPVDLEGLDLEMMVWAESSSSAVSLMRLPMTVHDQYIEFTAHPAAYQMVELKADGFVITPRIGNTFESKPFELKKGTSPVHRFLVRRTTSVEGRVLQADGTPHKDVGVYAQIENITPEGAAPDGEWAHTGFTETNAEGRFTMQLPPGKARVSADARGYVIDREYSELDVSVSGPNLVADFHTKRLDPIRGRVVDGEGRPAAGAIVRARHWDLRGAQPIVSDSDGRFELAMSRLPQDPETRQQVFSIDIAAFVTDRLLSGRVMVDLQKSDRDSDVVITLRPEDPDHQLLEGEDTRQSRRLRSNWPSSREKFPAGRAGQTPPELDAVAWFNTDARSLKDLRGRYVLLDFWFIGCGPCHYDFPSVKLVHERFEKLGVTVIGVHNNSASPEAVREHCDHLGIKFPIVVDQPDGRIWDAYEKLGVRGAPSYLLLGPDGTIVENDHAGGMEDLSLRGYKLELVRQHVLGLKSGGAGAEKERVGDVPK